METLHENEALYERMTRARQGNDNRPASPRALSFGQSRRGRPFDHFDNALKRPPARFRSLTILECIASDRQRRGYDDRPDGVR